MPTFKVSLHRLYNITIQAGDENKAKQFAEYFLSGAKDDSSAKDKEEHGFTFVEIEMTANDAFEAVEMEEEGIKA